MRIRIHRGTAEIGGNCIEVEAQGKSIPFDLDGSTHPGTHSNYCVAFNELTTIARKFAADTLLQ